MSKQARQPFSFAHRRNLARGRNNPLHFYYIGGCSSNATSEWTSCSFLIMKSWVTPVMNMFFPSNFKRLDYSSKNTVAPCSAKVYRLSQTKRSAYETADNRHAEGTPHPVRSTVYLYGSIYISFDHSTWSVVEAGIRFMAVFSPAWQVAPFI